MGFLLGYLLGYRHATGQFPSWLGGRAHMWFALIAGSLFTLGGGIILGLRGPWELSMVGGILLGCGLVGVLSGFIGLRRSG